MSEKILNLVKVGKFKQAKDLVKKLKPTEYEQLNEKDDNGNSIIFYFVNANDISGVEELLKRDVYIDVTDVNGKTIIFTPIQYGNYNMVKLILKYNKTIIGASILDIPDRKRQTPLNYAIGIGNKDIVRLITKYNNPVNMLDKDGYNSLHNAINKRSIDMVKYVLHVPGVNINYANGYGEYPINMAVVTSNIELVKLLIDNGADPNKPIKDSIEISVHDAVNVSTSEMLDVLIENGGDINAQDRDGYTVLHIAFIKDYFDMAEVIWKHIKNGKTFNCNLTNISNDIALLYLLKELVIKKYGFQKNNNIITDDDIPKNIHELLLYLIKYSNLNKKNDEGLTPLTIIILNRYYRISGVKEILLEKNLDISSENTFNFFRNMINKEYLFFTDILIRSYINNLKKRPLEWKIVWENACSGNVEEIPKEIIRKAFGKNITDDVELLKACKNIVHKEIIKKAKKDEATYPHTETVKINLECKNCTDVCKFIGSELDSICGILYLKSRHKNGQFYINITPRNTMNDFNQNFIPNILGEHKVLDYSITWGREGNITFSNPLVKLLKEMQRTKSKNLLTIILSIYYGTGHANCIIYDAEKNEIERFEPNGKIVNFYNFELLDKILENTFTNILPGVKYITPKDYQQNLSIQAFENKEKIVGEFEGYCLAWSILYADMRLTYRDIPREKLDEMLVESINNIKLSPKRIIIDYSNNITHLRDRIIEKANMDINHYINGKFSDKQMDIVIYEIMWLFKNPSELSKILSLDKISIK